MTTFRELDPEQLTDNPFKLVGKDWMLIAGGGVADVNMMTASWGGLGVLWGKPVAFVFVRPSRHTYGRIEDNTRFTCNFFTENFRDALNLCGSKSGRDLDKVKATGLTPRADDDGAAYFDEARLVLVCRKLYHADIDPARFLDAGIASNYPTGDYHRMYVAEIERSLVWP